MTDALAITRAREDARRARARLADDFALLQRRASPSALAHDAAQTAREAAAGAADSAVTLVKEKPIFAIGGIAALGLVLSARPLRRAAAAAGSVVWRNRSVIERLFTRSKAGTARRREDKRA